MAEAVAREGAAACLARRGTRWPRNGGGGGVAVEQLAPDTTRAACILEEVARIQELAVLIGGMDSICMQGCVEGGVVLGLIETGAPQRAPGPPKLEWELCSGTSAPLFARLIPCIKFFNSSMRPSVG